MDFEMVNSTALVHAETLLPEWLPTGKIQGREWMATNPTRNDRQPGSFKVNLDSGKWADFATDDRGGDLISLFAYLNSTGQLEAAEALSNRLNLDKDAIPTLPCPSEQSGTGARQDQPTPVPSDAGEADFTHPRYGKASQVWTYLDGRERLLGYICRFDLKDGSKQIRPLTFQQKSDQKRAWQWRTWDPPRPLYGLDRLAKRPKAPVMVCEGEKATDAAQKLFPGHVAVTSPGGSGAAALADWRPLQGRKVVIWPDADEPGQKYAADVAQLVYEVGAVEIKLLNWPLLKTISDSGYFTDRPEDASLPKGYDAADAAAEGWDSDLVSRGIENGLVSFTRWPSGGMAGPHGQFDSWPDPVPLSGNRPKPLPKNILPGIIGRYAAALTEALQVPYELSAACVLGVVSASCAGRFQVEIRDGYVEPVNLYLITALPPGERKSATMNAATAPIVDWEKEQAERIQPEINRVKSEIETIKAIVSGKRKRAAAVDGQARRELVAEIADLEAEQPQILTIPRLLVDDITPEAAGAMMAENGERLFLASAEGGIFDTLAGRYNQGMPNLDLILKGWGGEPVRVDRRNGTAICMNQPLLTICLSVQPEVLSGLNSKPGFRGRGLLGRFLYLLPESLLGRRKIDPPPVPQSLTREYQSLVSRLLALEPEYFDQGWPKPWLLNLAPAAWTEWKDFSAHLEKELGPGGRLAQMTDWAGKLAGTVARIAGLFHIVENNGNPAELQIQPDTMRRALAFGETALEHARVALEQMGSDRAVEDARKLWKWFKVRPEDRFSQRDLHRSAQGSFPKVADMKPGLEVLLERAYIFKEDETPKAGQLGRPPSKIFRLNPKAVDLERTEGRS